MSVTVHHGCSREVLKGLADASIDSVVCDPPYALVSIGKRFGADDAAACKPGKTGAYARASAGFMGKKWDTGETAFDPAFWVEVLRVLKPGGHLIAFGGTRTYHRLACAIEDAGFEVRDQLAWLYGSGFPKSHDVSKGIDKAAGVEFSSRPASGVGFMAADGPGGYNPTKNRLNRSGDSTDAAKQWEGWGTALKPALEPICLARKPLVGTVAANVQAHGTGALNIDASRIESTDGRLAAKYASVQTAGPRANSVFGSDARDRAGSAPHDGGRWPANVIHDGSDEVVAAFPQTAPSTIGNPRGADAGDGWGMTKTGAEYADSGSAARFFYSPKADATDRLGSKHPTVKPVDLMAYLIRLVTPPGGVVLDPFAGSGTTGLAAMREAFDCILIEREAEYVADVHRKLAWARGEGRLTTQEMGKVDDVKARGLDLPLFNEVAA